MSIIRAKKTDGSFYQADKGALYDPRLTAIEKYIISYASSRPDNWKFYAKEISKHIKSTRQTISKGINRLEKYGYVHKEYDVTGKFKEINYIFYESPSDNPYFTNDSEDDFIDTVLDE